jgi:acetyl-CoA acetyltransferase family protein
MGAATLDALIEKAGVDGGLIDDVIMGCVMQSGAQAGNIGRNCVLASSKLPETVPGTTVDRQCGSSQQAVHFAAQAVMSGVQDAVIACGVENMSLCPIGSNVADSYKAGHGLPMSSEIMDKYGERMKERGLKMFSQFEGAEMLAEMYDVSREEMDRFGLASHQKAHAAQQAGRFKAEIVPIMGKDKEGNEIVFENDEWIDPKMDLATMNSKKSLKERQTEGKVKGRITAKLASQICDGASAILFCNEAGLKKLGVKPIAKVAGLALAGADPVCMLSGPIPATENLLKKTGVDMKDIGVYEVNEAFCSVPLAWAKATGADLDKLNVNGGAMALGHPLGATGTKIMTTLVHEMVRRGSKYGLQAICEGGGTANATLLELCTPKSKL